MNSILKFSEATMLAMHSIGLIYKSGDKRLSTKDIAGIINASENHLAKIHQRLVKMGYIESTRGPNGGFILKIDADKINLLDIIESFEGKLIYEDCMMNINKCPFKQCVFGNIQKNIYDDIYNFFKNKKLIDLI